MINDAVLCAAQNLSKQPTITWIGVEPGPEPLLAETYFPGVFRCLANISIWENKYGTYETVESSIWPRLSGKSESSLGFRLQTSCFARSPSRKNLVKSRDCHPLKSQLSSKLAPNPTQICDTCHLSAKIFVPRGHRKSEPPGTERLVSLKETILKTQNVNSRRV